MFYGFNLGRLVKQRKPKKPFSQRTGLFDRELKDELKETYHSSQNYSKNETSTITAKKGRRRSGRSDTWDRFIEIIIAVLIVILVISILSKLDYLVGFF